MSDEKKPPYSGPAGGWPALASSLHHVKEQGIVGLGSITMLKANQPDGFDCPGCAWPDANHHSTFEFCENGVKAVAAEATARRAGPDLFAKHTVAQLAEQSDFWLEDQGRLTHPMAYDVASDKYVPIDWDDAFALIARHLNALPDPNQAIFYT
ncbi:MAG: CbbBc protein, partial [Phenylobacterium sp.]